MKGVEDERGNLGVFFEGLVLVFFMGMGERVKVGGLIKRVDFMGLLEKVFVVVGGCFENRDDGLLGKGGKSLG
ncbi:hypothetical protein [Neisseria sicca]|uniref:hypothetical protein n=1 Tax=Neisseria sicca TaxID=490 RepID=UPI0011BD01FE|nr:hypothetical protein [Neisseria sicca]